MPVETYNKVTALKNYPVSGSVSDDNSTRVQGYEVEAIQYTLGSTGEVEAFVEETLLTLEHITIFPPKLVFIPLGEVKLPLRDTDWVVKERDEFFVYPDEAFNDLFEKA